MDQEGLEILRMIAEKKVSAEQGAQLLEALKHQPAVIPTAGGQKPRFVRVKVDIHGEDGKVVAVNLNLPVALADVALKLAEGAKFVRGDQVIVLGDYLKQLGGVDIASLLALVKEGVEGKLVDVNVHGEDGEQVKVEVTVD